MKQANTNNIRVKGAVATNLSISHEISGESFLNFTIEIMRKSGKADLILVTISERVLIDVSIACGDEVEIYGQIRTCIKEKNGQGRLELVIFADSIELVKNSDEDYSEVKLEGFVCKKPIYRKTPFGKEIGDLMVAVNRKYGKSDYIPCLLWDRNAKMCKELNIGDKIYIEGRLQSRNYDKKVGNKLYKRTAYEVSVYAIEKKAYTP